MAFTTNELPKTFQAEGFNFTLMYLRKNSFQNAEDKLNDTTSSAWCWTPNPTRQVESTFLDTIGVSSHTLSYRDSLPKKGTKGKPSIPPMWNGYTDEIAVKIQEKGLDTCYVRACNDINQPVALVTIEEALAYQETPQHTSQPTQEDATEQPVA